MFFSLSIALSNETGQCYPENRLGTILSMQCAKLNNLKRTFPLQQSQTFDMKEHTPLGALIW